MTTVLSARGLTIGFPAPAGPPNVVLRDLSFDLVPGTLLGLAGESGSGKSTAALTAMGFPIPGSVRLGGSVTFDGIDLLQQPIAALRNIWGSRIAYVAQDASQSLSPLLRVERLLAEPLRLHLGLRGDAARARSLALLASVSIPAPETAMRRFPHQFSGGQQQRIALAIALACEPAVLILDEPTTGLDVTTQFQIVSLIRTLIAETNTAALMISHDLSLLAMLCDELAIIYAGEVVEQASAAEIYARPRHPYSAALIDAVPRVDEPGLVIGIPGLPAARVSESECAFADRCSFVQPKCRAAHPALVTVSERHDARCVMATSLGVIEPQRQPPLDVSVSRSEGSLLEVVDLRCTYRQARGTPAVDGLSLTIHPGETVALVGESGSGKSTALRAIAGLHPLEAGEILFDGKVMPSHASRRARELLRSIQIVFQDPHASLNPRHTVREIIERPLVLFEGSLSRRERRDRVCQLLREVRLEQSLLNRYPHQLSGGQKQRVAIARAFVAEPRLILCDEIVSALDVSVQASILELIAQLTSEHGTAVLFVTHDLAVVRAIASRIYVMRNGCLVEQGHTNDVFTAPREAYTLELLAAVPRPRVENAAWPRRVRISPEDGSAGDESSTVGA